MRTARDQWPSWQGDEAGRHQRLGRGLEAAELLGDLTLQPGEPPQRAPLVRTRIGTRGADPAVAGRPVAKAKALMFAAVLGGSIERGSTRFLGDGTEPSNCSTPRNKKSRQQAGFRTSSGETRIRTGDTTIFRQMLRTLEQGGKPCK